VRRAALHRCWGWAPWGARPLLISKVPWSDGRCLPDPNAVSDQHNQQLSTALAGLRTELADSSVVLFDMGKSSRLRVQDLQ